MAITLSQNEYANTLSNLIALDYVDTTINTSSVENAFISTFNRGSASFGDNVIFRTLEKQLTGITTLDTSNSDLLTEFKQTALQENLVISKILRYRTTLNSINLMRAFENGTGYNALSAEMRSMVQSSKNTDLFNYLRDILLAWSPVQENQTLTISASTSTSNYAPNTLNINKVAQQLELLRGDIDMYTTGYTDTPNQYTKGADSSMIFIWNAKYKAILKTDSFAILFNNPVVKDMLLTREITLPQNQINEENQNTIGWYIDIRKLVLILGGNVAGTFLDVATNNEQLSDIQYHNETMLKNYIGIKFIADGWGLDIEPEPVSKSTDIIEELKDQNAVLKYEIEELKTQFENSKNSKGK